MKKIILTGVLVTLSSFTYAMDIAEEKRGVVAETSRIEHIVSVPYQEWIFGGYWENSGETLEKPKGKKRWVDKSHYETGCRQKVLQVTESADQC